MNNVGKTFIDANSNSVSQLKIRFKEFDKNLNTNDQLALDIEIKIDELEDELNNIREESKTSHLLVR